MLALTKGIDLHLAYFAALERISSIYHLISAMQLHHHAEYFLQQDWIVKKSYQTHIMVSVLNGYDEVEIEIDERTGTFSYTSPLYRSHKITRPLSEVSLYAFNIEAWLDSLTAIFEIEPAHRARKRTVLDAYLWYLGEVRIARSHQFAPLYIARRLANTTHDWQRALLDPIRPSQGIVLTAYDTNYDSVISLPNGHQLRSLDCLLSESPDGVVCNQELLARLLHSTSINDKSPGEYFDEKTGCLKLRHFDKAITFTGIQKKIIKIFWEARNGPPLTWAEVKRESGSSAKGVDRAFSKNDQWYLWIERVEYGKLKMRA